MSYEQWSVWLGVSRARFARNVQLLETALAGEALSTDLRVVLDGTAGVGKVNVQERCYAFSPEQIWKFVDDPHGQIQMNPNVRRWRKMVEEHELSLAIARRDDDTLLFMARRIVRRGPRHAAVLGRGTEVDHLVLPAESGALVRITQNWDPRLHGGHEELARWFDAIEEQAQAQPS